MPPVGLPRPDEKTYDAVVASLAASLDSAAAARPNPGRTDTFRRLNRTEYQNAIRDLLALDVDIVSMLPGDEAGHGFDNVTVGNLSPMLLERYLRAAQKISRLAMGIAAKSPGGDTITLPPDLTQEQHFEDLPLGTHGGLVVRYTFPQDAEYDFTVRLQRDRNEHVEGIAGTHEVEVMLDGERVKLVTVKPPGPGNDHSVVDKDLTVRVPLRPDRMWWPRHSPRRWHRSSRPDGSPTRRISTWTGIRGSRPPCIPSRSTDPTMRRVPAIHRAGAAS